MLDASVVASWHVAAQATAAADVYLAAVPRPRWIAPFCLRFEVLNLLLHQERRRALPPGSAETVWADLEQRLQISVAEAPRSDLFDLAVGTARRHALSLYDAFYLLLAQAQDAVLVTRDQALAAAAAREGCSVHDVGP